MNALKRLLRKILFPHIFILICLLPVSVFLLVYSMVYLGNDTLTAYISYFLSAYALTTFCVRIPRIIKIFKKLKNTNKYLIIWQNDVRLRVKTTLLVSFVWNILYALFQLVPGILYNSIWHYSTFFYYLILIFLRFGLLRYTFMNHAINGNSEYIKYRTTGIILLFLNIALSIIVFLMIGQGMTKVNNNIVAIALAAFTFSSFTISVIDIIKYRKYKSPVYSAKCVVSLASSSVSMVTLSDTMISTFGDGTIGNFREILLGILGLAVCAFIISLSVYMIVKANKAIKAFKN